MSAILRVSGKAFDVDSYLEKSPFNIIKVYRKGEKRSTRSKVNQCSGINISVSEIDFDRYQGQLEEALVFLTTHEAELHRLRDFPGCDSAYIDFGAEIYPPGWCSFYFPHALLLKAGELRIDLGLSVYPTDPDEEDDEEEEETAANT